jgi:hypothetical protein
MKTDKIMIQDSAGNLKEVRHWSKDPKTRKQQREKAHYERIMRAHEQNAGVDPLEPASPPGAPNFAALEADADRQLAEGTKQEHLNGKQRRHKAQRRRQALKRNANKKSLIPIDDKDQFDWMAHEAYPAPEFTDAERQKLSGILEAIAGELGLSPQRFWADIQKIIDERFQGG